MYATSNQAPYVLWSQKKSSRYNSTSYQIETGGRHNLRKQLYHNLIIIGRYLIRLSAFKGICWQASSPLHLLNS
jgi:hypothetical protein